MKIATIPRRIPHAISALLLVCVFAIPGIAQGNANKLFNSTGDAGPTYDLPSKPYIKRSRPVTLNLEFLKTAIPSTVAKTGQTGDQTSDQQDMAAAAAAVQPLLLNLFPDVELPVTFTAQEGNISGSRTWTGKVDGEDKSLVILIVRNGIMTGNISVGNAQYQVRHVGNGVHVVHEINQAGYPSERDPDKVIYPPAGPSSDTSAPILDATATKDSTVYDGRETQRVIDVMVVYTPAARIAEGGTTAMENLIDLAVAETNTGYNNSGINQMLNLVHTEEVSYTESGDIQLDRDRLKNPSDGYMDNVHTLRNTYSADVVPLIVDNGGGYCGIAYIMDPVSTQFQDSAFCVVANECATGYYSFGHEIGHLMAARHDWYVDPTDNSPYTYNHGLTNPASGWRTVMAYNNACTDVGKDCTRQLYWSNPDQTFNTDPLGVREGSIQPADNRKTLANTGFVVANFRVKKTPATPSTEFASGAIVNNGLSGVMFDVRAKQTTTIHGFSTVFQSAGTVSRVEVYYRAGSYVGNDNNPAAWKLAGSINNITVKASPTVTHIPIDLDITIPQGQTYAFYVTTPSESIRYQNGTTEGALFASDNELELMEGKGKSYPFSGGYAPRVFAGTIYHSSHSQSSSLQISSPNNGYHGIMFDIKAKRAITLRGFSTYLMNGIATQMEIWYRKGSHVGHETTAADWTRLASVDNVTGTNFFPFVYPVENRIPMALDLTIPAGKTYGFYVTTTGTGSYIAYKDGTSVGAVAASNFDINILQGTGKAYPFGISFTPRVYTGTVYYKPVFPWPMFLPGTH